MDAVDATPGGNKGHIGSVCRGVRKNHAGYSWAYATLVAMLLFTPVAAPAQPAFAPPYCVGANMALQYNAQGWQCVKIVGEPGPAGPAGPAGAALPAQPPPSQCITSNWDGTKWSCVPTEYLTSTQDAPPVGRK